MDKPQDIYSYITQEETAYGNAIDVIDGWSWNMKKHIQLSTLYKNTQFSRGNSEAERDQKPFKNIIRPILNLQYRAEGFDVKDIELFVDEQENYYKSFLVKKFHEKWAREQELDTFIDDLVETYIDYGGVLVKNVNKVKPEVVPWQSIAFCDQTDILSGPIGIKHHFSPDQLKEMESQGWGKKSNGATATLDEVIVLAETVKINDKQDGKPTQTPGKYIEVYEVHGTLPERFLKDDYGFSEEEKYVSQLQIVCFYQKQDGTKEGITLFKGKKKANDDTFKLLLRDKIYGRALGFGGAEELFEPQIWINYDQIRMKGMLDAAAKVVHLTDDPAFYSRNRNLKNIENDQVLEIADGKTVKQMDTTPRNINLFDRSVQEWEAHAQQIGSANDSIMGVQPTSGTPFKLQELVTSENHSLHEYRKGKIASFLDTIYRDWILSYISKEITKEQSFLASLDYDEMQEVADSVVNNEVNNFIKESILTGQIVNKKEVEALKQTVRNDFLKGNKKFIKILEKELSKAPLSVKVNIAGKQKNLAGMVDKLVNIFRQIISNPQGFQQTMQIPAAAKAFTQILEYSGLSATNLGSFNLPQLNQPQPQEAMAQ